MKITYENDKKIRLDKFLSLNSSLTRNKATQFINQGKVITSFEADSDFDAIIEAQWKTDFIIRPGEQVKDALVRGQTKYYIIRWEQ